MRSQVRFAMHPQDEADFVSEVLCDPAVVLINGPRWKTPMPELHRSLAEIDDNYCIIWSKNDGAELDAEFMPACDDWYCRSEGATIQFLRSHLAESVLIEGRLAVGTNATQPLVAEAVERRYHKFRTFIRKRYTNSVLRWRNPRLPEAPKAPGRSANPSKPDATLWIGPVALKWLREDGQRRVKQCAEGFVEGQLAT
jgi:hypothetical protein